MTWRQQAGNFDTPINPEHEQEARLVDQARAGSERAFSALLARYQQPVFRLIFYLVGDADEARELSRIALKHSLTRMPRVPAGYSVRPWLLRVATLVALDAVREHSESPQALIASLQLPPAPQPATRIIDSDPTLSETMELSITKLEENPELEVADAWNRLPIDVERELVRRLLASLPENDAELLALGVVGQVPTRDLAAISGTSQRSIRRRIARALILFQSHYQMVRQDALPPPAPTKELDPGNISAVMAINVARRGLNEATERMRRSWHNVRASLGSVEAQESLQTLRDEDIPTATQSRPLTAPNASPAAKSTLPSDHTFPMPPIAAAKPLQPASERVITSPTASPAMDKSSTPAEPAAAVEQLAVAMQAQSEATLPAHDVDIPAANGNDAAVTTLWHERADATPRIVTPPEDATTIPVTEAPPTTTTSIAKHNEHADGAPEQQATAIRQLPRFGPPAEVAAFAAESMFVDDLPTTAVGALTNAEASPTHAEAEVTDPQAEADGDAQVILMPPASSALDAAESLYMTSDETDNDETATIADESATSTLNDIDAAASSTASTDTTMDIGMLVTEAAEMDAVTGDSEFVDVIDIPVAATDMPAAAASDDVAAEEAAPLWAATVDAASVDVPMAIDDLPHASMLDEAADEPATDVPAQVAIVATEDDATKLPVDENASADVALAADLAATSEENTTEIIAAAATTTASPSLAEVAVPLDVVSDDVTPTTDSADEIIFAEAPVSIADTVLDIQDNEASVTESAAHVDDVLPAMAAPITAEVIVEPAPLEALEAPDAADEPAPPADDSSVDEMAEPTTTNAMAFAEVAPSSTNVTTAEGLLAADTLTDDESLAAHVTAATSTDVDAPQQEQADATNEPAQDDASSPQEAMVVAEPVADVMLPYIARQEERTMPVSRHFGDTVVVRDDARLDYVARHQGKPIDLSDLSGIIGAAFSEQAEEPEATPSPTRPPAAGVLHIMPEAANADEDRFTTMAPADLEATIVAKPIAQPAREEVTDLTQPADLADLVGILSQMTQIRQRPVDDAPIAPASETKPRRLTRPMPRLDRDAPEPPNEEP